MKKIVIAICIIMLASPCFAANWYVDNAASGSNNGTSWTNAWTNLSNVVCGSGGISAGDTLYISGGPSGGTKTYDYTNKMVCGVSGNASNRITIKLDDTNALHNGVAEFDYVGLGTSGIAVAFFITGSYWDITGDVNGNRHLKIKNLVNFDDGGRFNVYGILFNSPTNATVKYIEMEDINNGITMWQIPDGTVSIDISYNKLTRVLGEQGIYALWTGGQNAGWDSIKIHHNEISFAYANNSGHPGGPDSIQASSSVSIYNNKFTAVTAAQTGVGQHPDVMQITGNYVKIYNNEFITAWDSFIDMDWASNPTPHDIWIFNNVFRVIDQFNTATQGQRFYNHYCEMQSVNNLKIFNNTFVDVSGFILSLDNYDTGPCSYDPTDSGLIWKNNLVYNPIQYSGGYYVKQSQDSAFTPDFDNSNNIYYTTSNLSNFGLRWGVAYTLNEWVSTKETNSTTSQPIFVSYTLNGVNNDLHLSASDTVSRGNGVNLSSLCVTVSEACRDRDGVARPASGAWDIGAYEYVSDTPELTIPQGVHIGGGIEIK